MKHLSRLVGLVSGLACTAAVASAQGPSAPSDSIATATTANAAPKAVAPSPFHGRQWGAEFQLSSNTDNIGVIRFHSPTRAFLLNVGTTLVGGKVNVNGENLDESQKSFEARLGYRLYHAAAENVVGFASIGALAEYSHQKQEIFPGLTPQSVNSTAVGGFGELGGAYLVNGHLSLGFTYVVAVLHRSLKEVDPNQFGPPDTIKVNDTVVDAHPLSAVATIYF